MNNDERVLIRYSRLALRAEGSGQSALSGTGSGESNVSEEGLCRMLTVLDRMGKLD